MGKKWLKVKDLISELQKYDPEKEIKAKYYYKWTDNDEYCLLNIEEKKDKLFLVIKRDN